MKLVQLLAKELKEWPESVVVYFQWGSGEVFATSKGVPTEYSGGMWYVVGRDIEMAYDAPMYDKRFDLAEDRDTATVNKSQWQAEREKMNKPKWIRHRGGKCPVPCGTKVETRHRDGDTYSPHFHTQNSRSEVSANVVWKHQGDAMDIMAYRVIEETKDQEIEEVIPKHMAFGCASKEEMVAQIGEECPFAQVASVAKDTNLGTLTYKLEIDATEATQRIDSLVAKWGHIVSPLKWRDEIIELEAYEEEFRREREKLIRKLESEGFKLIDRINCNLDKIDQTLESSVDMSNWKNWMVGDVVCATQAFDSISIGQEMTITRLDHTDEEQPIGMSNGSIFMSWPETNQVKFVRRP